MAYSAGTAFLQVVPSFAGVVNSINAEAAKWGDEAGNAFQESFKAAVGDLSVRATLDDTAARAQIDEFAAKLDEVGAKSPNARLGVDNAGADAAIDDTDRKLDEFGAKSPTARANVDTSDGIAGVGGLLSAILALGPAAIAAAGVATAALAAIPAALSGVALGGAAAFLGLDPVIKSLTAVPRAASGASSAMGQQASAATSMALANLNAAHSAETAAQAVVSAQQQVVSAQQAVVTADQNVITAEQSLANAQYTETQAQQALTAAREAATNQLQTYHDQLADAALTAQQDQINLANAQLNLQSVQGNPSSTPLQIQQAQLAVAQATQAIKDQQDQYNQLKQTADQAFEAGVNGSQQVTTAQHNLLTAQQGVQAATVGVTNAQTAQQNAQAGLAKAVDGVNQAIQNQAYQAQVSALQLQQAANSARTAGAAGGSAATPVSALGGALSALTPAGQSFVNFIKASFLPLLVNLSAIAQNNLLPGIQAGLTAMQPLFNVIGVFIGVAAQGIGNFVASLGQMLSTQSNLNAIATIFGSANGFMQALGVAAQYFIQALINIGSNQKVVTLVQDIGKGIDSIIVAFAKWTASKGFNDFLAWVLKNGPVVVQAIQDLLKVIFDLIPPLAQIGIAVLKVINPFLQWLNTMIQTHPVVGLIIAAVLVFVGVLSLLLPAITAIVGVIAAMSFTVGLVIAVIAAVIAAAVALYLNWDTVWNGIKSIVEAVWSWIYNNVLAPLIDFFTNTIPHTFDNVVGFFSSIPGRIAGALGSLFSGITGAFGDVAGWVNSNIIQPVIGFFTGLPQSIGNVLSGLGGVLQDAFDTAINLAIDAINILINGFDAATSWVPGVPHIDPLSHVTKKAAGGPVLASVPYVVGEKGQELFIPEQNGTIVPHGQFDLSGVGGSSGGPTIGVQIGHAEFKDEADVDILTRKMDFALMGRRP